MSIGAIISNPKNKSEELLHIPIASEKYFDECWIPIIRELDLKWVICFQSGIEITFDDLQFVISELKKIKYWILIYSDIENTNFMGSRIDNLINKLKEVFKDESTTVYIG